MSGNGSNKNRIIIYAGLTVSCLAVLTLVLFLVVSNIKKAKNDADVRKSQEMMDQEHISEHLANVTTGPFNVDHDKQNETPTSEPEYTPTPRPLVIQEGMQEQIDYYQSNDIKGYIRIDGPTDDEKNVISYPIVQTYDNDYYMYRDLWGNYLKRGSLFMDYRSDSGVGYREDGYASGNPPTDIIMIYGHNMKDSTMFGILHRWLDTSYAEKHKYIEFDSLYEHRRYEIISVFRSRHFDVTNGDPWMDYSNGKDPYFRYYYFVENMDEATFDYWYSNVINRNETKLRGPEAKYGDEFIVLSTCSSTDEKGRLDDDARLAVVAVRIE